MAKSAACRKRKAKKRAQKRTAQNTGGSIENVDGSPGIGPLEESSTASGTMECSSGIGPGKKKEQEPVAYVSVSSLGAGNADVDGDPNDNQFLRSQLSCHNEKLPHVSTWARECAHADLADSFSEVRQGSDNSKDDFSSESRMENTSDRREETGCNNSLSDSNITIGINGSSHIHVCHHHSLTHHNGLSHQNGMLRKVVSHADGTSNHKDNSRSSKLPGLVKSPDKKEKEAEAPISEPISEVAPLIPSTNRWVPKSRIKKDAAKHAPDGTVLLSEEEVKQKTKSALNKVTLEMMGPISEILLKICKQSLWEEDARTLKLVLELVLAKACDEPYWSSVYAYLCAKIINEISPDIKDMGTLKNGVPESGGQLARRILLSCCQEDYGKESMMLKIAGEHLQPAEFEMLSDEYYAAKAKQRKGLGLIKLIGNLFKVNLLKSSVVIHCLRDLLDCTTVSLESSLAMLIEFLRIVGPIFDANETTKASMNQVFHQLDILLEKNQMMSRSKYTLMNLQEQRANHWKVKVETAEPKTIKQIHDEADAKNQAKRGNYRGKSQSNQKSGSSVNGSRTNGRGGRSLGTAVWASKPAASHGES